MPEDIHVIEAERGDAAHHRAPDAVGRIQSAAQADLQNHHIHPLLQENLETYARADAGEELAQFL